MGRMRTVISAAAVLTAAAAIAVGGGAPAQAFTGVDLYLHDSMVTNWDNGAHATMDFTFSNEGATKTPGRVTLTFDYQLPIEPAAPNDGGFKKMSLKSGPTGTTCAIDRTKKVAKCSVPALAAGKTETIVLTSVADAEGAGNGGLPGSFLAKISTPDKDVNPANNSIEGGWVIVTKS